MGPKSSIWQIPNAQKGYDLRMRIRRFPIDGGSLAQTGTLRFFESPPEPGKQPSQWTSEGVAWKLLHNYVSGQSKPASEGQMKTTHFESGIAHEAAVAALMRDEPTHCEPVTIDYNACGQRRVGSKDRP